MKIKKEWNNWRIFFTSLILAVILTPLLEPFYKELFGVYSGNEIFPVEISTYPGTAALLYIFLITFLYTGFAKKFKGINLFYFLIIPLFLVSGPTYKVLTVEFILVTGGFLLGKLIRNKLRN